MRLAGEVVPFSRIAVLSENTARAPGILGEHGLAFWIEAGRKRVLFDTGQGRALRPNAKALGIDLAEADALALSHGHYDHTGGCEAFMKINSSARVYFHPGALKLKYIADAGKGARRVSLSFFDKGKILEHKSRLRLARRPVKLPGGLFLTGPIPRANDFEDTGGPFYLDKELKQPDLLRDDQALFFRSKDGLVVLLGCAHAGVVNTLDYIARLTGEKSFYAVAGGMHLEKANPRRLQATLKAFRKYRVKKIGPAHCAGIEAVAAFWQAFPGQCFLCPAGSVLPLEKV